MATHYLNQTIWKIPLEDILFSLSPLHTENFSEPRCSFFDFLVILKLNMWRQTRRGLHYQPEIWKKMGI